MGRPIVQRKLLYRLVNWVTFGGSDEQNQSSLVDGTAVLALAPCSALGQAVYGAIYGTVTDATGALIPNAPVVVTDTSKGTTVAATSNESGEFRVEHLIPDAYSVTVDQPGFKKYEQTGIQVNADSSTKIDAVLSIGTAGEVVTVNADTVPQLKTDRADVAVTYSRAGPRNIAHP